MDIISSIRKDFAQIGLEPDLATIYTTLLQKGPQTISALARNAQIERTKVYRLLDDLARHHLIEVEERYKRQIIHPSPVESLYLLADAHQLKLQALRKHTAVLEQQLQSPVAYDPTTRVQRYHGVEGIRQMLWKQTQSKTEVLSIMDEPINEIVGGQFLLRWASATNQSQIASRLIRSKRFNQLNDEWYQRNNIESDVLENFTARDMPDEVFAITYNTDIWEDKLIYYSWHDGDVYAVEIHNQKIADSQRQLFELLWGLAKKDAAS